MSKTNTEKMAPETQTPEMANGMKLDVPRASDCPNGKPAGVCQCYDWRML